MDANTVITLIGIGFSVGAAWVHLGYRVRGLNTKVDDLTNNHLPHIERAIKLLPCNDSTKNCPLTPDS